MKIRNYVIFFIVAGIFILVSCDGSDIGSADITDEGQAIILLDEVRLTFFGNESSDNVIHNFLLPELEGNYRLTWKSSNTSILEIYKNPSNSKYSVIINNPASNVGGQKVILTATIEYWKWVKWEVCDLKDFNLTIIALSDEESLLADKESLDIIYDISNFEKYVTKNLSLPVVGQKGSSISWSSNNTSYVTNSGLVTRPTSGTGHKSVNLTATITNGTVSDSKIFNLVVIDPLLVPGTGFDSSEYICVNNTYNETISVFGEIDYYKIYVDSKYNYKFSIYSAEKLWTRIILFNEQKEKIKETISLDCPFIFHPSVSGYYYISIDRYSGPCPLDYTFQIIIN